MGPVALQQKHESISYQLANNAFKRPLVLNSVEAKNAVAGNAYAVIDAPYETVNSVFKDPSQWCDILILHLNTKACASSKASGTPVLVLHVGKKTPQPLKDTTRLVFSFRQIASTANYSATGLNAELGPMGTRNYTIELETVPLPGGKTFMHLRYGYEFGTAAKLAMQGYLATMASEKVGFSAATGERKGEFVGGVRGTVERNTMRYYLAIDAYLASLSLPESQREQSRLESWYDSNEKYPRQLHELQRSDYLAMKTEELLRQRSKPTN